MGLEALFHRDDKTPSVPTTPAEWEGWVSASRTRNHLFGDPLLDWLNVHGEAKGFTRDGKAPSYDDRTDLMPFNRVDVEAMRDVLGWLRGKR